jgi:hypothetical protein
MIAFFKLFPNSISRKFLNTRLVIVTDSGSKKRESAKAGKRESAKVKKKAD